MTDEPGRFAQAAPGVTSATIVDEGQFVHQYRGTLDAVDGHVRLFAVAPGAETAVADAFSEATARWQNPSTHPNIVSVYTRETEPRPWVGVAVPDGRPLSAINEQLGLSTVAVVVENVAEALRNANLYNTAHLALSPECIWVAVADEPDGVRALVDEWGLHRTCRVAADEPTTTPFTAPELIDDPTSGDERTDVYGLAAVAYDALTGTPPTGPDDAKTDPPVTPPSDHVDALPPAVDGVILRALSPDPDDRHDSPYAFASALKRALPSGLPSPALPADDGETADANEADVTGTTMPEPAAERSSGQTDTADETAENAETGPSDTETPTDDKDETSDDETATDDEDETSDAETPTDDEDEASDATPRLLSRRAVVGLFGLSAVGGVGMLAMQNDRTPLSDQSTNPERSKDGTGAGDTGDDTEASETSSGDDSDGDTQPEGSDLPEVSGTYDTVTESSFTTLNPLYNTQDNAETAIRRALDPGYIFDDNQEYFPLLYDMSTDNGEVWVFEVREGLEFSDPYGEVTAESFVYQIQELHQSDWANTADASAWPSEINVEQNSTYEFQAELPNPQILWPESLEPQLYPIPRDLVEPYVEEEDAAGLEEDEELLELQFTGNLGPFTLEEWERSAGTTYTRTEDYYLQDIDDVPSLFSNAPYFEEASIDIIEERSSRLGALETGEADVAAIPPARFEEYQENESVDVYRIPQPYAEKISVNMRDNGWSAGPGNLFRHVPFRQAMAMAISKQDLIDGVFRGLAQPQYTWQPRFSQFYLGEDSLETYGMGDLYGADVAQERAQQAFEQSDYDYAFDGDMMVTPSGDRVTLNIYHSSGQETEQLMAEFIAEELGANLGIQVNVNAINGVRFNEEYWTSQPEGGIDTVDGEEVTWENPTPTNPGPRSVTSNEPWDMEVVFGLNTYPRNPLTNTAFFDGPTGFYNPVGYYPGFDAQGLFDQAEQATSAEEIQSALVELFANINKEQPYIMLAFPDSVTGYNPDIVGPIENFSNGWDLPVWYFDR